MNVAVTRTGLPGDEPPAAPDLRIVEVDLDELAAEDFLGEIAADAGTRTVHATDNSVYRLEPAAVIFPRDERDVRLAAAREGAVPLTPRSGTTGTDGQSAHPRRGARYLASHAARLEPRSGRRHGHRQAWCRWPAATTIALDSRLAKAAVRPCHPVEALLGLTRIGECRRVE